MSSPASGVAAQAPSSATANCWGMHVRLLPLQNTQTHLAGDQNAESKMCHIAATIFVAGVAAIVADAAIAMALATGMEVVFAPQQQQQPWQQQQRQQQKQQQLQQWSWPVAARVGAASPPAVVECWFSCGSAWVMVQLGVT